MTVIIVVAWSVIAVIVDVAMARVAFGAIVPSLQSDLGLTLTAVGAANTANLIGYAGATPFSAWFIRRVGVRRAAVIGHVVAAGGALWMAESSSFIPIVLARVVTGVGGAFGLVAVLRITLDAVPARRRVLVSTITWFGVGFGVLLAASAQHALLGAGAWRAAMWFWAALTLLVALMTPRPQAHGEDAKAVHAKSHGYGLVLASYGAFGFAYLAFTTFLAMADHDAAASRWTWLGVAALAGAAMMVRVRKAEPFLALALGIAALGAFCTVAAQTGVGPFLVGLGLAATPGLATAIVRARVPDSLASEAIANTTLAVAIGQLLGPVVAGALADRFGIIVVPLLAGTIYVVGFVLVLIDIKRGSSAGTVRIRELNTGLGT